MPSVNLLSLMGFYYYPLRIRELFQIRFVGNSQFMTTFLATAGQHFTAIGGLHALTKSVNAFAPARMGLECTFHDSKILLWEGKIREKCGPGQLYGMYFTEKYPRVRLALPAVPVGSVAWNWKLPLTRWVVALFSRIVICPVDDSKTVVVVGR